MKSIYINLVVPVKNLVDTHYQMISIIVTGTAVQVSKLSFIGGSASEVHLRYSGSMQNEWELISKDSFDNNEQAEIVAKQLVVKYLSYDSKS